MTDRRPKVAVVTPTFNRWPHVRAAIDSVLAQTYAPVECVVVDDASTDETVEQLQHNYGERIRLIVQRENGEKSAARNAGIRATDAPYVAVLDSDDTLTPTSVEDRMRPFLDAPAFSGVSYGLSHWGNSPTTIDLEKFARENVQGDVLDRYLRRRFVHNNDYLLSRENMLRHGMYKEDLTNREDVELLVRLAARFEFRFCGSYVTHVGRVDVSARSNYDKYLKQGMRVIDHLRDDPLVVERLGARLDDLEREELLELARANYKAGRFGPFKRLFHQLLKRWPRQTLANRRLLKRYLFSLPRR